MARVCCSRAVGQHEALRQRQQLRLPRPGRPLLVGRHRPLHHRHQRLHDPRRRQDVFGGDRVALLRHGRGVAASLDIGLRDLGHLGLRQQDHVGRDLAEAAADQAEKADRLRDPVARHMPRRRGGGEPELRCQALHHRDAAVAERRERAGGSAELHLLHARTKLVQPLRYGRAAAATKRRI